MEWTTLAWIAIAIVAIWVMVRGCGGMMGGMSCGMPRRRGQQPEVKGQGGSVKEKAR